jgi:hypothetical protein
MVDRSTYSGYIGLYIIILLILADNGDRDGWERETVGAERSVYIFIYHCHIENEPLGTCFAIYDCIL